jgi:predicted nucleic acid-binding Zn ribbon protein
VDLLSGRYRQAQEREDRRVALIAWVQVEMNRDSEKRSEPYTLEEMVSWLGHGFQRPDAPRAAPPPPPSAEDLLAQAQMLNALYGGQTVNGTHLPSADEGR